MDGTVKPVCLQPILETRVLLHQRNPIASDLQLVGNLRTTVIVQYRVDFFAPLLQMESVQKPLPSRNEFEEFQVGECGRCGADVLYSDPEEPRTLRRGRHLDHVGVSLDYQLRTISRHLGVDVPDQTG